MFKPQSSNLNVRRSCLTGKIVWIYRGPSKAAASQAYYRACKKEMAWIRNCEKRVARRRANIARFLADCMAELPINVELSPQQKEAARQIQALEKKDSDCHSDFYEHIMEERRRRRQDREIRLKMHNRRYSDNG